MPSNPPSGSEQILKGRHIASLGTQNQDNSIHLTAVWYLFDAGCFYVATASQTRKARNAAVRPTASLMLDIRIPASEHGLVAVCNAEVLTGEASKEFNARIHARYMSKAALADPRAGGTMAAMDDVTLKFTPTNWYAWDMRQLDQAVFGGSMKTPGYLLPLD